MKRNQGFLTMVDWAFRVYRRSRSAVYKTAWGELYERDGESHLDSGDSKARRKQVATYVKKGLLVINPRAGSEYFTMTLTQKGVDHCMQEMSKGFSFHGDIPPSYREDIV